MVVRSHDFFIWIPQKYTPAYDVKIDGVSVLSDVYDVEFNLPVTEKTGQFEIILDNNHEEYSDAYSGGETVQIYLDNDQGNTLKFTGYIEHAKQKFGNKGSIISIEGSHVAGKLLERTVTESYVDQELSVIFKDLMDTYATGFSYDAGDIIASTTTATLNFNNKPLWECFIDLCTIGEYDCYIDNDSKAHFFPKNSIECVDDAVVFSDNHLETTGLGENIVPVKNKVIVYGNTDSEIPIVYTVEDTTSQASTYLKETVIRDSKINTYEEAKARGDAELAILKDPMMKGKTISLALYYLNPGEKMWISLPPQKIHNKYRVTNITHLIESGYATTECEVEDSVQSVPKYFRQRLSKEIAMEDINNPNKMEYSYNFTFDDETNIATLSNMEVSEGYLRVTAGQSSGSVTSSARTAPANITSIELRVVGEGLADAAFKISVDNRVSWQTIDIREVLTPSSTGKYIALKIDASSSSVSIDDCVLLYKTT